MREIVREPVANAISKLEKIFYNNRTITCPSFIHDGDKQYQRPLFLRNIRAEIFLENDDKRKERLEEARLRDEINKQYLNQKDFEVDMGVLGKNKSKYVILEPKIKTDECPVFFIPGISNDLDCVGSFVSEIAYQGRKVICLAYPESYQGSVTKNFSKRVGESTSYQPHTEFFKRGIEELVGEKEFELWGLSLGGGISQELMLDTEISQKVKKSVLICPSNMATITQASYNKGLLNDFYHLLKKENFCRLPSWAFTHGPKPYRNETMDALGKKAAIPISNWEKIKNKTLLLVGQKDYITNGIKADFDNISKNPNIKICIIPNGIHATPVLYPEKVLKYINVYQESKP